MFRANMPIARCTDLECMSDSMEQLFVRAKEGDERAKLEIARRKYNHKMKNYYADYGRRVARGEEPLPEPAPFRGIEEWDDAWLGPAVRPERKPPPPPPVPPDPSVPPPPYPLGIRKVLASKFGDFYAVYYAPGKFYSETCDTDMAVVRAHFERLKAGK
jgi:hypothetical protein